MGNRFDVAEFYAPFHQLIALLPCSKLDSAILGMRTTFCTPQQPTRLFTCNVAGAQCASVRVHQLFIIYQLLVRQQVYLVPQYRTDDIHRRAKRTACEAVLQQTANGRRPLRIDARSETEIDDLLLNGIIHKLVIWRCHFNHLPQP